MLEIAVLTVSNGLARKVLLKVGGEQAAHVKCHYKRPFPSFSLQVRLHTEKM
jgi:hypothetical protein